MAGIAHNAVPAHGTAQGNGRPMAKADAEDFLALKQALQLYVQSRTALPPAEREVAGRELGELLVSLVSTADRLQIDLVRAAEEHVTRRAGSMPRLVKGGGAPKPKE